MEEYSVSMYLRTAGTGPGENCWTYWKRDWTV